MDLQESLDPWAWRCRYPADTSGTAAAVDELSMSAATPEEDLASEPPLMPPDADWALTAAEAKLILGAQVRHIQENAT